MVHAGRRRVSLLSYWEALDWIARGKTLLTEAGIRAEGFVAPSWLINEDGMQAARDLGFPGHHSDQRFKTSRRSLARAPSLVFGPGHLNEDVGIGLQRLLSPALARYRIARVILHPPCIIDAGRLAQAVSMIRINCGITSLSPTWTCLPGCGPLHSVDMPFCAVGAWILSRGFWVRTILSYGAGLALRAFSSA